MTGSNFAPPPRLAASDVPSTFNCDPLTAWVEPASSEPGATLSSVTGPAAAPTSVTFCEGTSGLAAVGVPAVEYCSGDLVCKAAMAAPTLACAVPATLKLAAVLVVPSGFSTSPPPMAVAADVARLVAAVATENSCEPLTASVDVALSTPAPTFWIWRSLALVPTETTEATTFAAVLPPVRSNTPVFGPAVAEPAPSATSLALIAVALLPSATELLPMDVAIGPMATESVPVAVESASTELAWK